MIDDLQLYDMLAEKVIERTTKKLFCTERFNLSFDERVELEFEMAKAERALSEWKERYRMMGIEP